MPWLSPFNYRLGPVGKKTQTHTKKQNKLKQENYRRHYYACVYVVSCISIRQTILPYSCYSKTAYKQCVFPWSQICWLGYFDVEAVRHSISFGLSREIYWYCQHCVFEVKLKLSPVQHSTLWLIDIACIARNLCYDFSYILAGIAYFLILEIT